MTRTMAAVNDKVFNKTIFISLEMHGVAFSSVFFWVIPAVFLGSIIGVSQTEERIRRILRRFHNDLDDIGDLGRGKPSPAWLEGEDRERVFCGGVYSWRPVDWHDKAAELAPLDQSQPLPDFDLPHRIPTLPFERRDLPENQSPLLHAQSQPAQLNDNDLAPKPRKQKSLQGAHWISNWLAYQSFWPIFIVAIPNITGALLSSRIPPGNWNCRVIGELGIFAVWLISAQLDFILDYRITLSDDIDDGIHFGILGSIPWWRHHKRNKLFWMMYAKDVFCTLATLLFLMLTVSGCLNACSCWMDRETGLILPQRPDIDALLRYRLHYEYPAYVYVGMGIELIIVPFIIWRKYPDALRVFVQRDDGESNWRGYWKMTNSLSRWWRRLKTRMPLWKREVAKVASWDVRNERRVPADGRELDRLHVEH